MKCKFNLKADNGKDSKLFKDIAETVTDPKEAIDIYYFTKTPQFKEEFGDYTIKGFDKSKLDENGEPLFDRFSEEAYIGDKDYVNADLGAKAELLNKIFDSIPAMKAKINDSIEHLVSIKSKDKTTESTLQNLKDLKNIIESGNITESIPKFLNTANNHTWRMRTKLNKLLSDSDSDIRVFANMNKIASGYTMIDELNTQIFSDNEIKNLFNNEDLYPVGRISGNIAAIQAMYTKKSMDFLAKEFHKRDKFWSIKDIKKELEQAPRDVRLDEHLLEFIGDSSDRVISMVGEIMMEANHKKRKAGIEFSKRLSGVIENAAARHKTSEDMFEKLIVTKDDGSLHLIDIDAVDGVDAARLASLTSEQKEFLTFFTEEYTKLQEMLPSHQRMGTRLPTVLKSNLESLKGKSIKERYNQISSNVKKQITSSNLDLERGEILDGNGTPARRIPVFYTQKYDSRDYNKLYSENLDKLIKQGVDLKDAEKQASEIAEKQATAETSKYQSRDLSHLLQSFHAMAVNYSAKNELVHVFEAAEAVVGSRQRKYFVVDSGGKTVINKNSGLPEAITGEESQAKKAMEKFLGMHLYSQKEKDLGYVETPFGFKVDTNKSLRLIGKYNGITQLAGNILATISNIGVGEFNNKMEAFANEFFDSKSMNEASGLYKKNLSGILGDIGQRVPQNFVNLLEEHYNILQSYGGKNMKADERSKAVRLMKTDALYFMNASSEHFMQVRGGLAMLAKEKAYDKQGEEIGSALEMHSEENGKLVIKDFYVKDKEGNLTKYDNKVQDKLSNKIGGVLRKMHGNYSAETAGAAKQDARLALALQFRGWAYEGLSRRYGRKSYNRMTDTETEGFYRTGFEVTKTLMKDIRQMNLNLTKEHWSKLSAHEKANVRRYAMEVSMIALLGGSAALFSHAGKFMEDEFDGDNFEDRLVLGSYQTLVYELNRLYTEVFAFANPVEAVRLARSPVAAVTMLENTGSLLSQMFTDPFAEYEGGWRDRKNKLSFKAGKLVPLYKQVQTLNPDGIQEKTRFFN